MDCLLFVKLPPSTMSLWFKDLTIASITPRPCTATTVRPAHSGTDLSFRAHECSKHLQLLNGLLFCYSRLFPFEWLAFFCYKGLYLVINPQRFELLLDSFPVCMTNEASAICCFNVSSAGCTAIQEASDLSSLSLSGGNGGSLLPPLLIASTNGSQVSSCCHWSLVNSSETSSVDISDGFERALTVQAGISLLLHVTNGLARICQMQSLWPTYST